MKYLIALLVCLCAGPTLAGDSSMFSSPAFPLTQMTQSMGVDIIGGDTVKSDDPRFEEMLALDAVKTQLAALDSLGYKLDLDLSIMNACQATKPGSGDTSDVEYLFLSLVDGNPGRSKAYVILVSVPAKGFTSPPLAYIESYVDPGDATYTRIVAGVDQDGNDRYVWMKYMFMGMFDAPPEEPDLE